VRDEVRGLLLVEDEVQQALDAGTAVVALESTLVTHGLPYPQNLEAARRAEAAVRAGGAVPATVVLRDGRIRVGLQDGELAELASAPGKGPLPKVSRQTLAAALGGAGWGGTTVAATLIAAAAAGIRVFATGGIGGVHRGGESSLDVSADLAEIGRAPVAVICAGPKAILDVPRTLEALETLGVPVVGWGTDEVAGFFSRSSGLRAPARVDGVAEAAALVQRQAALGLGGVLFCVPLPEEAALPRSVADAAIERAIRESEEAAVRGPAATPWVLDRVAALTGGRSVTANLALIEHNAGVAAELAVAVAALPAGPHPLATSSNDGADA
jgi:pseudouridylate synthase